MPLIVPPAVPSGTLSSLVQPVLRDQNLTLRPFVAADADDLAAAYSDTGIQQWHARTMSRDEAIAWVAEAAELWSNERGANWAIEADGITNGQLAGRMGLRSLDLVDGVTEVAYWVRPSTEGEVWRSGVSC